MHALKTTLREYGYTRARLETSDQNVGHGFTITGLWAGEEAATQDTMLLVEDKLSDEGLLDLDWEIGEDAHGVLMLDLIAPVGERKFFATEITVRVLSVDVPWDGNLEWLSHDVTQGEYVGDFTSSVSVELSREEMAEALVDAGSDPDFFGGEYVESVKETFVVEGGTRARFQSDLTRVRFRPQAWINDNAVDVDVEDGQTDVWFVEADNEYPAQDAARESRDLDWLKLDWFAPDWVKDWTGPFEIEVLED